MPVQAARQNKAITMGHRAFKSIDADNLRVYGFSYFYVDGNLLRAAKPGKIVRTRKKSKEVIARKTKIAR